MAARHFDTIHNTVRPLSLEQSLLKGQKTQVWRNENRGVKIVFNTQLFEPEDPPIDPHDDPFDEEPFDEEPFDEEPRPPPPRFPETTIRSNKGRKIRIHSKVLKVSL